MNRDGADEPIELQVERFLATRAVSLSLRGVPGIYLPSLFGARNDTQTALASKDNRSINRKAIQVEPLVEMLSDRRSWVRQVATRFRRLLKRRAKHRAFHPNSDQRVLDVGPAVFAVVRTADAARGELVLALINVTAANQNVRVPLADTATGAPVWRDALSLRELTAVDAALAVTLDAYEILWLVPDRPHHLVRTRPDRLRRS